VSEDTIGRREGEPWIGRGLPRLEDPRLLLGRGRFVDDISLDGMLEAAFVRSPLGHAAIRSIDATRALELPGVHAVFTGDDLRAACSGPLLFEATLRGRQIQTTRQSVLPTDRVRFVGEPVAIVVADSRYVAEDAVELVEVDWDPLPAVVDENDALRPGAPVLHDNIPDNNFGHIEFSHGDVDGVFAGADRVFSKRFRLGRSMAAPLECRGTIARYDAATGDAEMWATGQGPYERRHSVAAVTGIPETKLRVVQPDVGGAFGLKGLIYPEDPALLVTAKILGRPIKWIEDRFEHLAASSHSKEMTVELEAAVRADGKLLGLRARYVGNAGAYAQLPPTAMVDALLAATMLPSVYDVDAVAYSVDCTLTNKCPTGAARGVGWVPGQLARELLIDEIARELELDPAELRLANCIGPEPRTTATGLHYDGGSYAESIRTVLEQIGYEDLRREQGRLRAEGRYLGVGISPYVEPAVFSTAYRQATGFGIATFDTVSVTVESDGSVIVRTPFHSQGQGHHTSFAQLAADEMGVPVESVRIEQGDTAGGVFGLGTFASRSAVIAAGSIAAASREVREKLLAVAGHQLEIAPEDLVLRDGLVTVRGSPSHSMPIGAVAHAVYFGGPAARPRELVEPTLSATRHHDPPETYSNGTMVAVVEVDIETGIVEIVRMAVVEDCGTVINPLIVDGQAAGAVAQGIGMALLEELHYDEHGQLLSGSLMDYLYPSATDVPAIEIDHLETPSPVTAHGVKGMSNGGTIAAPSAIAAAVADALTPLGVKIDRAPITPDYLISLLGEGSAVEHLHPEGHVS